MTESVRHVALDTSCIVALVCPWHEHHERTHAAASRLVKGGAKVGVVAHTLVETYAVLTRLPAPHRLSVQAAEDVLRRNFENADVVSLSGRDYWALVKDAKGAGIGGGRVYDMLIAKSAARLFACTLLTLNPKHFAGFDVPGFTIASALAS